MFEDQLFLSVGFEHYGILVEGTDAARQLHPAHQVNGNVQPLLTSRVEEGILNVLRRLAAFHSRSPLVLLTCDNTKLQNCSTFLALWLEEHGGTTCFLAARFPNAAPPGR